MSYGGYKQGRLKSKGGLFRAFVKFEVNRIEDITFSGDFFLFPKIAIEQIALSLKAANTTSGSILSTVRSVYESEYTTAPWTAPQDFTTSLCKRSNHKNSGIIRI